MRHAFLVALAMIVAVPGDARANVGRARFPGARSAEPTGLRGIAIEREELTFDLRPLADGEPPRVAARYHLVNGGDATVTAPLVFVSGVTGLDDAQVTLDAVPLATAELPRPLSADEVAALPAAWSPPSSTPALDDAGALPYETEGTTSLAFTLAVPPGPHELQVTYRAVPQRNRSHAGGTILWQLGYVLAPARDWGGFGTLDLAIQVPAGWRAAASPTLVRSGDTLRARFASLPADTIGITVQAPTGTLHAVLQIATPVAVVLVLLGGILALVALGRRLRDRITPRWPTALGGALGWAIAIGTTGGLAAVRSDLALPAGQSAYFGYGHGAGVVMAVLGAVLAVPIGMAIALRVGRRSTAP